MNKGMVRRLEALREHDRQVHDGEMEDIHPRLVQAQREALQSMHDELMEQLEEYENREGQDADE